MKKAMEWLKSNLLVLCIAVILCMTINTMAETVVPSAGVSYSNSKTSETTVNGALDELFETVKINEEIAVIKEELSALKDSTSIDEVYPVGSIYISTSGTNPGTLFAGTKWETFGTGRTLVGVNTSNTNFSTVEKTGGSSSVTLTEAQLPSHSHGIPALSGTAASNGAHTHTLTAKGSVTSTFTGSSATSSSAGAHQHYIFRNSTPTGYNDDIGPYAAKNSGAVLAADY